MFNNQYSYNFKSNNNTFHQNFMPPTCVPPPPKPPPYIIPAVDTERLDQEFLKSYESKITEEIKITKQAPTSISAVRDQLKGIAISLNKIKDKEKDLSEKIDTYSEEEWKSALKDVNELKQGIDTSLNVVKIVYLDLLKRLLAKRAVKRLRLKKLRAERKREKLQKLKELKEKSRKIDEHLQKIKDDIKNAKEKEEAKIQADIVLRETLRKKHNAKKCITKLDALKKLRKARENTAKGRGEQVSESDSKYFDTKIEKIKSLWAQKLMEYEKEEEDVRGKLNEETDLQNNEINKMETEVTSNLNEWRKLLFGNENISPQVDFHGDIERFINVRHQWDNYINESGSPLPVGWVISSGPA